MRRFIVVVSSIVLVMCIAHFFLPEGIVYAQEETGIKGTLRIPDSSHIQVLKLKDGTTLHGRIIEIGKSNIQIKTDIGKLTIPITKIKEIKEIPISSIKEGKYWFPNPNETRLFFAPTGRCLKRGEGYFADYYILFPFLSVGVTDNITLSGGVSIIPFLDLDNQFFYFSPKVGIIQSPTFALSIGTMLIKPPGNFPIVGILYGVGTSGSPDGCITVGLGYGFKDWDFADKPMVMIGGEARVSRRLALVTENWLLPGVDQPLISYGLRFFGEALSVDLAFINTIGDEMFFPGVPYIDFVFKF